MPRVLGGPRGVGIFLWARYPCRLWRALCVWLSRGVFLPLKLCAAVLPYNSRW